jgi:hypothetical protein
MAIVFKAVIRTFLDVRYFEDKCCHLLFWSSIETAMKVVGAERRAQLLELLPPCDGRACMRSDTAPGSAQAIKKRAEFCFQGRYL